MTVDEIYSNDITIQRALLNGDEVQIHKGDRTTVIDINFLISQYVNSLSIEDRTKTALEIRRVESGLV